MTQNTAPVLNATVIAAIETPEQTNTKVIQLFDKGSGISFLNHYWKALSFLQNTQCLRGLFILLLVLQFISKLKKEMQK